MAIGASFPPLVPNSQPSTKRSPWRIVLVVVIPTTLLVVALLALGVHARDTTQAKVERNMQAGLNEVREEVGIANVAAASAASAAELQATHDGIPLQAVSTSLLDSQLRDVTWVGASSEAAYTTTGKRMVAIAVQDGHVLTAVQPFPGQCNFGLVVTSPSDPIIVTDHIGGPGVFGSNVDSSTTHCDVASAPNSWLPVTPKPLSSFAQLLRPEGGCTTSESPGSAAVTCPLTGAG
ncbi:MAG TPA: hypothetical protein VIJ56_12170 [Acidimicrobiales bacterium]